MNNAISTAEASTLPQTSSNSNAVGTFDEAAYSYYDQSQMQRVFDRVNELIGTLRR